MDCVRGGHLVFRQVPWWQGADGVSFARMDCLCAYMGNDQ
jgi:hypothetical protein